MSARSALGLVLLVQAAMAPLVLIPSVAVLWVSAIAMTALGALQWPIVQAYLAAGRHGADMRNAIGWWNASWMLATAIGLALAGPLEAAQLTRWAIPMLLPVNLLALVFLAQFPKRPASHDAHEQARHVPPPYRPLLAAARVLHPMGTTRRNVARRTIPRGDCPLANGVLAWSRGKPHCGGRAPDRRVRLRSRSAE
jgi:MFS family permease